MPQLERTLRASHGVHANLRQAGVAAEVLVVTRLDAGLSHLVARLVDLGLLVELPRRHLAHVAEHLRRQRLVRVVAQVGLLDLDARELGRVLVQVGDLVLPHGRLHGDRVERVGDALVHLLGELERRHPQDLGEVLDDRVAAVLRQVAHPELHGRAGDVVDDHLAVAVEDRPARRLEPDRA